MEGISKQIFPGNKYYLYYKYFFKQNDRRSCLEKGKQYEYIFQYPHKHAMGIKKLSVNSRVKMNFKLVNYL